MGDSVELAGFVDEASKGERDQGMGVGFGPDEALAGDFFAHDGGFEFPCAVEIGVGVCGEVEEGVFGGVAGVVEGFELGSAGFEEFDFVWGGGGLDGFGVEAVTAAVVGGFALSGGGDGSAGPGSVLAGGFDLFCCSWFRRSHCGFSMHERRWEFGVDFWIFLWFVGVRAEK
jgi:hypothetical protein